MEEHPANEVETSKKVLPKNAPLGKKESVYTPKSLEEGMSLSRNAVPYIAGYCEKLISVLEKDFGGGKCEYKASLKEKDQAEQKLSVKYNGDMEKLGDLVRCRIVCDTIEQVRFLQRYVSKNESPCSFVDKMQKPNDRGYRDTKFILVAPEGAEKGNCMRFELQFTVKELAAADKETHDWYEEIRPITDKRESGLKLTPEEQEKVNETEKRCTERNIRAAKDYNARVPNGEQLKLPNEEQVSISQKHGIERGYQTVKNPPAIIHSFPVFDLSGKIAALRNGDGRI